MDPKVANKIRTVLELHTEAPDLDVLEAIILLKNNQPKTKPGPVYRSQLSEMGG